MRMLQLEGYIQPVRHHTFVEVFEHTFVFILFGDIVAVRYSNLAKK